MNILHIAKIKGNKALGVDVVVPQHVVSQSKYENVAFVNLRDVKIDFPLELQLKCDDVKNIPSNLQEPFNHPDLVVFHEVNNIENIYIYKNLKKLNIPYVIIPHGELTTTALKKKFIKKKIAYLLLFNAFINNSLAIQNLSEEELNNTKFKKYKFVGTNGIFDNAVKKDSYFVDGFFKMLYLGRLEMNIKGLDRIIDAISNISDYCREHKIILDIYGPDSVGRKQELLDYINNKNVSDLIKVHDPIFDETKHEIMRSSDIFVQTSRSEGMPVGILEAMNLGLPCLLTKGTRLVEIAKKYNACYYAGETINEISNSIVSVYEDRKNWKTIAENAIKMTREEFEWEKVSKSNIEKYKELLKGYRIK